MAFNPNMHKKRFCPRQNKTPLAGTLDKFLSFPFPFYHSSSISVQFYSYSDDHACQESSVLPYRKTSPLFSPHKHLHKLMSSPDDRTLIQSLPYKICNKKDIFHFYFSYPLKAAHTYTWNHLIPPFSRKLLLYAKISRYYLGYSVLRSLCYFLCVVSSSLKRRTVFHLPWKTLVCTALI